MPLPVISKHRRRIEMLQAWARHDVALYRAFVETATARGVDPDDGRILDLGCGSNAPMTVLLHARGCRVTGVDHRVGVRWGLGIRPSRYLHYAKEVGVARAARKAIGEVVYDRRYYRTLAAVTGLRLTDLGLDLREMDIHRLEFENGSFDLVHSNATWEHVADVGAANRELARVLRPGGLAYVEIHLFPSLSGGHDLPWIVPGRIDLDGRIPWRHLRDRSWTPPVYLNRLRERDYRQMFEMVEDLEIVDWRTEFTEGEELLTADLLRDLPGYSAHELTKRSVIAILRKRVAPAAGRPTPLSPPRNSMERHLDYPDVGQKTV